ncbi:hypothetical protein [Mesorhizobium sp.]|uniref:hypothetical protein n=1 Tax=Mesorhizobium sp. TaxID=1871066 RepID=UPI0025D65CC6|nr:hypothetical protein [Mesorhizobium sp.]
MTEPQQILENLLEAMETRVQEQEAELALFRKAAQEYRTKLEEFEAARSAEIVRTRKSIEVFKAELVAMRGFQVGSLPIESSNPRLPAETGNESAGGSEGIRDAKPTGSERIRDAETSESERIRDAARRILRDAGRPLMQREIKAKMDEIGVRIQSADPVELVRAALRRHNDEFQHVKGRGWTLASPEV